MISEGSLLCSKDPVTDPYHELVGYSPHPYKTLYLKSSLILSFHLRLEFLRGLPASEFLEVRVANLHIHVFIALTMFDEQ